MSDLYFKANAANGRSGKRRRADLRPQQHCDPIAFVALAGPAPDQDSKRALCIAARYLLREDEAPSALRGKVEFLYELMTRVGREDLVQLRRNKVGRFGRGELSSFVELARNDRSQAGRGLREATIYLLLCIVTKVTPCAERAAELSGVFERSTGQKKSHILIGFCDLEDATPRFRTPDPASFREPCPPGEFTYFVDIFRIFSRLTESSDEFLGLHKQIFLTIAWLGRAELHQGTQDAVDLRFLMFALVDKIIAAWLEVDSNGSLREFVVDTITRNSQPTQVVHGPRMPSPAHMLMSKKKRETGLGRGRFCWSRPRVHQPRDGRSHTSRLVIERWKWTTMPNVLSILV